MLNFYCLLLALLTIPIPLAYSTNETVSVIKFSQILENCYYPKNILKIQFKSSVSKPSGYSFCIRFTLDSWSTNSFFGSPQVSFYFDDYQTERGMFYNLGTKYIFSLKNSLPFSKTVWNLACAVYNESDLSITFTVNGKKLIETVENVSRTDQLLSFLNSFVNLGDGLGNFTGQITDLNIWSKPLTKDEIGQLSTGCDVTNLDNVSRPDKVAWSEANFTTSGKCVMRLNVRKETICRKEREEYLGVVTKIMQYENAYKFCKSLNGDMVLPLNKEHFRDILNETNNNNVPWCNVFWLPIKKSIQNASVLIRDTRRAPQEEITYAPWDNEIEKHDNNVKKECFYANSETLTFNADECSIPHCSICLLEKKRSVLNIKLYKEEFDKTDTDFLLSEDSFQLNGVFLSGLKGLSYIFTTDSKTLGKNVALISKENNCQLASFIGDNYLPVGIQYWSVASSCNIANGSMSKLKLTNVSFYFLYYLTF
jgi:hypothetical protein